MFGLPELRLQDLGTIINGAGEAKIIPFDTS